MGRFLTTIKQAATVFKKPNAQTSKWCEICQTLVDVYSFQSHLHGRKHLRKAAIFTQRQIQISEICQKGIRIEEPPPSQLGWEAIINYFEQFGKVLAIVKLLCNCVLLQFDNIVVAKCVLQSPRHIIPLTSSPSSIQPLMSRTNYSLYPMMQAVTVAVYPRELSDAHLSLGTSPGPLPFQSSLYLEQSMRDYFSYVPNSSLSSQLYEVVRKFQPSDQLKMLKNKIMWDLSSWLSLEYPNHLLYMFGSSVMGLDIAHDSDIDFFFKYKQGEFNKPPRETRKKLLNRVGYILSAHPDVIALEVISNARVPILKFQHLPTGIMCDLNCENEIGTKRSQFIAAIMTLDARISPYFFVLKLWAKAHQLLGNPTVALSSYSLVLLCLYYLQQTIPSVIPPIATLQSQVPVDQRVTCDGWNLSYKLLSVNDSQTSNVSLFSLVKGFFEFYRSFDSKDVVICPLVGECIPTEKFLSTPPALDQTTFKPYLDHLQKGGRPLLLKQLTVQDPFELNNNVTCLYKKHAFDAFQSCCEESYKICCDLETLENRGPSSIASLFAPFAF